MFSPLRNRAGKRLREPFGKAGLTVAVIALVFAMLGGAYAASDNGGGKATVSKAKAGPRGPRGKTGPAGPAGPQGPAGANGKDGANGSNGKDGSNGTNGKDGQSVTGTPIAAGGECGPGVTGVKYTLGATSTKVCNGKDGESGESPEGFPFEGNSEPTEVNGVPVTHPCHEQGGVLYEVESSGNQSIVCNGAKGEQGDEGKPWTDGGTLPVGATETGAWSVRGPEGNAFTSISFPIPIAENGRASHGVIFFGNGEEPEIEEEPEPGVIVTHPTAFQEHCPGTVPNPQVADAGDLCIYYSSTSTGKGQEPGFGEEEFASFFKASLWVTIGVQGYSRTGAVLKFTLPAAGGFGSGSYAIKGCSTSLPVGDPNRCP